MGKEGSQMEARKREMGKGFEVNCRKNYACRMQTKWKEKMQEIERIWFGKQEFRERKGRNSVYGRGGRRKNCVN